MSTDLPEGSTPQAESQSADSIRALPARAIALVTSPRSVFEELKIKPAWFGATLLLAIFSILLSIAIYDSVVYPMMLDQLEAQAQSSEQIAQMEELYSSPAMKYGLSLLAGVMNFVFVIITGLLLYAICGMILGGKLTVRHGFSVAAHAFLVHIPRSLVLLPIMFSQQDSRVSLGPGVLFPPREAIGFGQNFLASFLGGLDLFNIWALALCILGMSVITGLATRKVGTTLSVGYVVLLLIGAAFAGLTGPK